MIITRTPFRISFFGGGTDFSAWYETNGGMVLSTTIDKYCYVSLRQRLLQEQHLHRVICKDIDETRLMENIKHPTVKNALQWLGNKEAFYEVHHDADLPACSGMATSSAFAVGLVKALQPNAESEMLSASAQVVEQSLNRDIVGDQDQVACAYGGFNLIEFPKNDEEAAAYQKVTSFNSMTEHISQLQNWCVLFRVGNLRGASFIENDKLQKLKLNKNALLETMATVPLALEYFRIGAFHKFGELMHEAWQLKKSLSSMVTNHDIDLAYDTALRNGALGGKLLGAGGGGFMLFIANPYKRERLIEALKPLQHVPFKFESTGCHIIYSG